MKENSLGVQCQSIVEVLKKQSNSDHIINDTNVYQEANKENRKLMNGLLGKYFLEGSCIEGLENFEAFYNAIQEGKRGLILSEHFSNMDAPAICYLLDRTGFPFAQDLSKRIVAIAGMKLNEVNPLVKALAEAFTRIMIYPSRSLASITDPEKKAKEEAKSRKINMASMHALTECRKQGKPVLLFPSGTRYRPGKPETRQGLREIDSYLRMFDVMIFVSINGNCLRLDSDEPENMLADLLVEDTVLLTASPVMECKQFRNAIINECDETVEDKKVVVVSKIMEKLLEQHNTQQAHYLEIYKKATGKDSDYTI